MSEIDEAIDGLTRKHVSLADDVKRHEAELKKLKKQVSAIDVVMAMFEVPRLDALFPQKRKEISRLIFEALRAAGRPMTSVELSDRVLSVRRIPAEESEVRADLRKRVRQSLAHHRRKGVLLCQNGAAGLNEYTIA